MSKEVDERVVSMQFDNKHFERNVQTTMSTLDKLKAKLHLPGAAKGLTDVSAAAKKVDLSHVSKAAETVGLKFNAMYTVADQALRNITNSAMAAGKRIVSALTIDPVKTGFNEYELKMDSVKTIMASTGESIETVSKYLQELNEYSDQTIYSFADMTQNIGKFTNAGVKLEDAVLAIKGISNEAALSGANANEASRAMYNFAQALSVGYIQRIDWKSIELANMATVEFKNQLLEAAIAAGTVKKNADGMYATLEHPDKAYNAAAMFTETLDDQWLTTEVLISTLKDYSDATTDIGKRAYAAAQDVTELSQMFDILKETAQSGWAYTWELIFGDLEQAKALFTPLTEFFQKFIDGMNDARNTVLESALGKSFTKLLEPLKGVKKTVDGIAEPIKNVTKTLEDYNKVVKEVINGDWGVTEKRWNALTEAGYDWATVQNMVNEELGCSKRHATDFTIGQASMAKSTDKATESNAAYIAMLSKKSDEELRALGLKEEQINAIKQIRKEADKLGMSVEDFVKNIDKIDGRWVMLESFKNVGKALSKVFGTLAKAWKEIFPPKSTEEKANSLYNLLAAIHKFTAKMIMSDDTANKLRRTLKGVFAIIDILATVTGGALRIAFKVVSSILGVFHLDILDVTAIIGDALVGVRDFVDGILDFGNIIKKVIPLLKKVGGAFADWIKGIKEADNIPKYIIQGLVNGLVKGVKTVIETARNLGAKIIEAVKDILGIHSPSTEFFSIGTYIIQGLVNGIKNGLSLVWDVISTVGKKCIEWMKDLDIGTVIAGGIAVGMVVSVMKIADAMQSFANAFDGIGDMMEGLGDLFEDFGKSIRDIGKGIKQNLQAKAMLSIAIALGILVAAIVVLTMIDTGELWGAIGALAALSGIMVAISFAASKMSTIDGLGKQTGSLLAIAGAMLILAIVMKKLASIDGEDIPKIVGLLAVMLLGIAGIVKLTGELTKQDGAKYANNLGKMMLKISIALLILVGVIKLIDGLEPTAIKKGLAVMTMFGLFCAALIAVSKLAGENASKAGGMILKISIALGIMVLVMKLIAGMDRAAINKGMGVIASFGVFCAALIAVSKLAGQHATKAGSMLLMISFALAIVVGVMFMIGQLSDSSIEKGLDVIGAFGLFCAALIAVSKLAGQHATKAGSMLLMISGAILILTGVIFLMSLMNPSDLGRGIAAITALELCFAGLIAITKMAKSTKQMQKTLLIMMGAIALLSVIAVALSFVKPERLAASVGAISVLSGVFAGLIAVTKTAKNTKSMRKTLIQMLGVVAVLALIIAALSYTNPLKAIGAASALSIVLTAFSASMAILGHAGKISSTVSKQIYPMLAITAGLALILGILGGLNVEASIPTATALGILLNSFAASMAVLGAAGKISTSVSKAMIPMLGVVTVLAVILGVLSGLDCQPSIETAISLSILLVGFSAALLVLSNIGPQVSTASTAALALIKLVAIIGAFVLALGALNELFGGGVADLLDSGIEVMEKIGLAIGSFVGGIVGGFASGLSASLPDIGTHLSEFMTNAQPFIQGCQSIDGVNMLASVGALSAAILVLTAADLISGIASFLSFGSSFADLGKDLSDFMINAMPFIAGIKMVDATAVDAASSLASMILSITAAQVLNGIASFITGGSDMATFGEQLTAFGKSVVEFSNTVKGNIDEDAVNAAANAGMMMTEMASTIPNSGGVVGFFCGENDMDDFAAQLIPFGKAITQFSTIVSGNVDEKAVKAASHAGMMMTEMASTIPNSGGVVGFFCGENDMDDFAAQLVPFGKAITQFSTIVSGNVDEDAVNAAANAGKMMAEMASTLPNSGGVVGFLCGENDMGDFAAQLVPFGEGIAGFSKAITGENAIDTEAISAAANAGKALAEMASFIPNSGGLISLFTGDNDMEEFAAQLKPFGSALASFSSETSGIKTETVTAAAEAGKILASMANSIPESGGLFSVFTGDNDMGEFGEQIAAFGKAIKDFSASVSGVDASKLTSVVQASAKLMELVVIIIQHIDALAIMCQLDFTNFATSITSFGSAMVDFSKSMVSVDYSAVTRSVPAIKDMLSILDYMPEEGLEKALLGVGTFRTRMSTLAQAMVGFSTGIADLNTATVMTGVAAIKNVMSTVKSIGSLESYLLGVGTFRTRLSTLAQAIKGFDDGILGINPSQISATLDELKTMISTLGDIGDLGVIEFVGAFEKGAPKATQAIVNMMNAAINTINGQKSRFYNAGSDLATNLINGFKSKQKNAADAAKSIVSAVLSAIGTSAIYTNFSDAGSYVVSGFVNGINSNAYKARVAAAAMANAAEEAVRKALNINSPSKVFRSIGYSIPEGFAMGIDKLSYMVTDSSVSMGDDAIAGVRNSISRISDAINGDIDSQPTIRPVMDLSDVTSGVGTLNSMLGGMTPSIGVMANVNSIGSMMSMGQNGGNGDVVSAINDLRKSLGNISGNTYNVNGVTYDDGSNITEAVKSLVHAAKIERRI